MYVSHVCMACVVVCMSRMHGLSCVFVSLSVILTNTPVSLVDDTAGVNSTGWMANTYNSKWEVLTCLTSQPPMLSNLTAIYNLKPRNKQQTTNSKGLWFCVLLVKRAVLPACSLCQAFGKSTGHNIKKQLPTGSLELCSEWCYQAAT